MAAASTFWHASINPIIVNVILHFFSVSEFKISCANNSFAQLNGKNHIHVVNFIKMILINTFRTFNTLIRNFIKFTYVCTTHSMIKYG